MGVYSDLASLLTRRVQNDQAPSLSLPADRFSPQELFASVANNYVFAPGVVTDIVSVRGKLPSKILTVPSPSFGDEQLISGSIAEYPLWRIKFGIVCTWRRARKSITSGGTGSIAQLETFAGRRSTTWRVKPFPEPRAARTVHARTAFVPTQVVETCFG